jgi:DNA-binding SARP family transcriptional activator
VLGPLEVLKDGCVLAVDGPKRRALLALLLLHADEVVSSERLVDELWGEQAPPTALTALHNHISRLRKSLGTDVLVTRPRGYLLRVAEHEFDLDRFQRLVADAADLEPDARSKTLREALALWRGGALADVELPFAQSEVARLEELRLLALEERIEADLSLGRHAQLVPELEAFVAEHPLRERVRGQLIVALYRCERQADALQAYRDGRRLLADELGLEPSPELRELERSILRHDPGLSPPPGPPPPPPAPPGGRSRRVLLAAVAAAALAASGTALAVVFTRGAAPRATAEHVVVTRATDTVTTIAPSSANVTTRIVETVVAQPPRQRAHADATAPHRARAGSPGRAGTTQPPTAAAPQNRPAQPGRQAASSRRLYRLADDFSGEGRDPRIWEQVVTGTQVDIGQQDGWLVVSIGAGSVAGGPYDVIDGHFGTQCKIARDFDARVDYVLLDWPEGNGVSVALAAYDVGEVARASSGGDELYSGWIWPGVGGVLPVGDVSGSLRIRRVNGRVTNYFRRGDRWVEVSSGTSRAAAVTIALSVWSTDPQFGHKPVRAAFDNFVVTAPEWGCPPGQTFPGTSS